MRAGFGMILVGGLLLALGMALELQRHEAASYWLNKGQWTCVATFKDGTGCAAYLHNKVIAASAT